MRRYRDNIREIRRHGNRFETMSRQREKTRNGQRDEETISRMGKEMKRQEE